MPRNHSKAWLYVGREYVLSFTIAFLFFFFLFFINQILVMAEVIFSKKVAFWDVVKLIAFSLPIVVAFAFPFGSLVGALMAVGRLSSDNELLAFGSLGVPPRQLLVPLLALGIVFSLISFVMNDYFLPLGNLRFAEIYRRILYSNPALELAPYSVKKYENTWIITGTVEGHRINDILIIDKSPEGNRRIFLANEGELDENTQQAGVITLKLDNVFTEVSYPHDGDRYDYTRAKSMEYNLQLKNITNATIGVVTPSSMSSVDVLKQIRLKSAVQDKTVQQQAQKVSGLAFGLSAGLRAAEAAVDQTPALADSQRKAVQALWRDYANEHSRDVTDQTLRQYLVEINRKFSMPAACLVFAFFAFPVGVRARRSGRTVGFGVGLFVAIVYWGLLIAGQTFGIRMSLSPAFSMWLPDAVVLAAGAVFFLAKARR
jgi:lipopolysaccharide export system permease protein